MAAASSAPNSSVSGREPPASLYQELAETYDLLYQDNPIQRRAVARLVDHLPDQACVVDLGCGSGRPVAEALVAAGHRVIGYDSSPRMLEFARERCPSARFEEADIRSVHHPAGGEPIDAVVAHLSLLALRRVEIEQVVRRARTWLAPGGLLSLVMVDVDADGSPTRFLDRPTRISGWSGAALAHEVRRWGFEILEHQVETFQPDRRNPERQADLLARRTDDNDDLGLQDRRADGRTMDLQQTAGIAVGRAVAAEVLAHAGASGPRRFVLPEHVRQDCEVMLRSIWTDMTRAGPLWSNIRVIHDGRDLHPSRFMDATLGDGLVVQSFVDSRAIARYIGAGDTLVYNHLHETSYPVQRIQETLEYELDARVYIQVYVTRAGRTAFGRHHDDHNFVILQLVGPKSWQVDGLTTDEEELTLTPGDGLLVRAETQHAVSGVGELSVHMNIAFDWLEPNEERRGSAVSADDLARHRTRLRVGGFLPVAPAPELVDSGLTFRSASRVRPIIEDESDKVVLHCATGTFRCSTDLRPLLAFVVDGRPVTLEGMTKQSGLDRETVKAFATFAVTKGIMVCG